MTRLRHRHWNQRIVILAMAALLWSQFALAGHGGCLDLPAPVAVATATATATATGTLHDHGHGHDCDGALSPVDQALCAAHCSEGGISADSGRLPTVQPLCVGTWLPWIAAGEGVAGGPGLTSIANAPPR